MNPTNPNPLMASDGGLVPPAPEFQPRLLLVDDEPRLLTSLYELLRGHDYQLVFPAQWDPKLGIHVT